MFKRIAAIGFIVVCTSIAWAILGSTIVYGYFQVCLISMIVLQKVRQADTALHLNEWVSSPGLRPPE